MLLTRLLRGVALLLFAALIIQIIDEPGLPIEQAHGGGLQPTYVGNKACGKCHFKQRKSYRRGEVAKAFTALKPGEMVAKKKAAGLDAQCDYTTDPKCLACHTTGYGKPGGYPVVTTGGRIEARDRARAVTNAGVTCEACHGPGSLYSAVMKRNKKYRVSEIAKAGANAPLTSAVCVSCHKPGCPTMPKGYKFDYAGKRLSESVHAHKALKYEH